MSMNATRSRSRPSQRQMSSSSIICRSSKQRRLDSVRTDMIFEIKGIENDKIQNGRGLIFVQAQEGDKCRVFIEVFMYRNVAFLQKCIRSNSPSSFPRVSLRCSEAFRGFLHESCVAPASSINSMPIRCVHPRSPRISKFAPCNSDALEKACIPRGNYLMNSLHNEYMRNSSDGVLCSLLDLREWVCAESPMSLLSN